MKLRRNVTNSKYLSKLVIWVYNQRMLRKWLSFVVMLAFVVSTMPALSHASIPHDMGNQRTVKAGPAKKKHHCHEETQKAEAVKAASNETPCPSKKSCCDGATCKCLGNACNGAAKVLGGLNIPGFLPLVAKETFTVSQDRLTSSLSDRIKRPPRS